MRREPRTQYETLDGCEVIAVTEKAVQVATDPHAENFQWIPRSVCENGDELEEGDTDICVERWFADKEDLPY